MALTFFNGTSFAGEEFTTQLQLLTDLHADLLTAGWISVTNTPASNLIELEGTAPNSDNCYVRFVCTNTGYTTDGYELTITMSHENTFVTNSLSIGMRFVDNQTNRYWLTADSDHFCMSIQAFDGNMRGVHAGFLDRSDPDNDTFAFALGYIANFRRDTSITGEYPYQIAKGAHSANNWHLPNNDHNDGTSTINYATRTNPNDTAGQYFPLSGRYNRHSSINNVIDSEETDSSTNAGYRNWRGNNNGVDDKPVLGEYYQVEGRNDTNGYTVVEGGLAPLNYFRGVVQNAFVGMSHTVSGLQVLDGASRRFMAVGDVGWQCMRIA